MSEPSLEAGPLNRALLVVLDAAMSLASESPLFSSPLRLQQAGLLLALLGFDDERASLGGSLYARSGLAVGEPGSPPAPSVADRERAEMTRSCRAEFVARGLCVFAEEVGVGGLGLAVSRLCRSGAEGPVVGCALVLPAPRAIGTQGAPSVAAQLFHESAGRVLLAIPAQRYADAMLLAASHGVPLLPLGRSGGRELVVRASDGGSGFHEVIRVSLAELASPVPSLSHPAEQ